VTDSDGAADAVDENAVVGTAVGIAASATDADATTNAITYSLQDNDGGRLAIDANTGIVTVAAAIDREADGASRTITVRATSADGSFTDQVFTIQINDLDEIDVGAVSDADATANAVNENAANGTAVGITASASDGDATTNTITYSLDDNAGGRFAINASTGVVTVAGAIDRETAASYNITVRATSADTSFSTQTFTIAVNDLDEFDVGAVTDADAAVNTVAENAGVGTPAGLTGLAGDADATATITYSLDDDASGPFAIHSTTGVVTVNAALDYETATSHSVTIRATSSDGSFSTQSFTIAVTDVNESGITAISDTDAGGDFVAENAANGTAVGLTAFADDPDGTDAVSYSLDDDAGGRFAIHATTGVVTVSGAIDREAAGSYNVTVRATSTDTTATTRTFTISLGDADEFDVGAVTDSDGAADAVAENAAIGTTVGITAQAGDGDATTSGITYSLVDDAGGQFTIDPSTGVVTVAGAIDRETGATRSITIRGTSDDGSTTTQSHTIAINDLDEFDIAPLSDADLAADAVDENAATGTAVGISALASDGDATQSTITYSLDDDAGGRFAIHATTGVLTVNGALDHEAATSHSVTIRATSSDGSSSTRTFTLNVNPLNDNNPVITTNGGGDTAAVVVAENCTAVTTVTATDADLPGQSLSYAIAGGADAARFVIDSVTGVVSFLPAPDYEAPADVGADNVYEVTVQVSDGTRTDTQAIAVTVTPVNEAPVLDNSGLMTLVTINEDETSNGGNAVAAMVATAGGDRITDVDAGSLEGIAITTLFSGNGTWQYSGDGGGTWSDVGAVSDVSALPLRDTDLLRFVPDGINGGLASFVFRAWDQTSGSAGSHVNVSVNGGETAFSAATATANITVVPVNDAPWGASDSYMVGNNSVLDIPGNGVLSNDADLEGDALGVVLIAEPQHGTLVLRDEGSFLYVPQISFFGADSFVYRAWDGVDHSHPVTVTIVVIPEAGPPGVGDSQPPRPRDEGQPPPTPTLPQDDESRHTRPPAEDEPSQDRTRHHQLEPYRYGEVVWTGTHPGESVGGDAADAQLQRRAGRASAVKARFGAAPWGILGTVADWGSGEEFVGYLGNELIERLPISPLLLGATTAVTITAGYVLWALRGGFLAATLLSSLPAWIAFDPLPIFDARDRRRPEDGDDDSLGSLLTVRKKPLDTV
jgi:hypothetical protein